MTKETPLPPTSSGIKKATRFQKARGVYDRIPHLPTENLKQKELWRASYLWDFVISCAKKTSHLYGYEEVDLPVFEPTDLFCRTAGESSDIVKKEMYTFLDKKGRSLTLRPELTASMARAFIENNLANLPRQKFFYIAPCFRYDRAQEGRYRQFFQFGVESFSIDHPLSDVETIDLLLSFYQKVGLKGMTLLVNSIGSSSDRENYAKKLVDYFTPFASELSLDSQNRLQTNPLRILDSKDPADQKIKEGAPPFSSHLSAFSKKRFDLVLKGLSDLEIPFTWDETLVRGLDYYTETVFEVVSGDKRQNALGAGGRYDTLVETIGGPPTPAVGFSVGLERVIQQLIRQKSLPTRKDCPSLLFIPLGNKGEELAFSSLKKARQAEISSDILLTNSSLKSSLKKAQGCPVVAIIGDEEVAKNQLQVKWMDEKKTTFLSIDQLIDSLKNND